MPDSQKISEKQSEYMNLIAEIMDIRKRGEKPVAYCFDELEYLNIDVLGMKGKSRVINIPNDRKQVWQQIENVLRNPVIRRFVLREDMKLEKKRH